MKNWTGRERDIVMADEVGPGKWLVTLMCGHKKYVREKKGSYICLECPKEEPNEKLD